MLDIMKKYKGSIILLITALIWGFAFVFQKDSMNHIGPFTFLGIRGLIAGIILIPLSFLLENKNTEKEISYKSEIIIGLLSGLFLFLGSAFQQIGLVKVSATKGGFLTSTYIVFVPVLGLLFKKKTSVKNWLCATLALVGFFIMCSGGAFNNSKSLLPEGIDFVVLMGAVFFALQIIVIDKFALKVNATRLNGYAFLLVGIVSSICALFNETLTLQGLKSSIVAILYVSIFSSCIAYTLQIVGQKYTKPEVASLIMSLESVFALLGGVMFLSETLKYYEIIGCSIIFICVIVSQINFKKV